MIFNNKIVQRLTSKIDPPKGFTNTLFQIIELTILINAMRAILLTSNI